MDEWGRGRRAKSGVDEFENERAILVKIHLPDSGTLRVVSRSMFLAVILLALPSIASIIGSNSYTPQLYDAGADWIESLPDVLHNLMEEGIIKKDHKGFIRGIEGDLGDDGVDLVAGGGAHQVFDYMSLSGVELMDGVVEDGGLAITALGGDLSAELLRKLKIVYLRRVGDKTVVAMRKPAVKQCGIGIACKKKLKAATKLSRKMMI